MKGRDRERIGAAAFGLLAKCLTGFGSTLDPEFSRHLPGQGSDKGPALGLRFEAKIACGGRLQAPQRIVGHNRPIARWFQAHFQRGDTVRALVLDAHHILLLSRPTT